MRPLSLSLISWAISKLDTVEWGQWAEQTEENMGKGWRKGMLTSWTQLPGDAGEGGICVMRNNYATLSNITVFIWSITCKHGVTPQRGYESERDLLCSMVPEEGDVGCHIGRHREGAPRELRESGDPLASTVMEGGVRVEGTSKSSEAISCVTGCHWVIVRGGHKGGLVAGTSLITLVDLVTWMGTYTLFVETLRHEENMKFWKFTIYG